jgi:predicted nucleic acid-binding protein
MNLEDIVNGSTVLIDTNDSLNLAIARRHGITDIATADKSFDAVQGVIVYNPAT